MNHFRSCMIRPDATIEEAMRLLDETGQKIVLVAGPDDRLLGTLTDGDVRRALLNRHVLTDSVSDVMHVDPLVGRDAEDRAALVARMRERNLMHIPVVDAEGKVVELISDRFERYTSPCAVVIMAGGLGQRLRPLTETCPKPMLKIGGQPILERILTRLIDQGFARFHIAVNFLSQQIVDHFGDGSSFGVTISYIYERRRMGTAGALRLLELDPHKTDPVLVMNGDLLTDTNYAALLATHKATGSKLTTCVLNRPVPIAYGVVDHEDGRIRRIEEKPTIHVDINAGIYCIARDVVTGLTGDSYLDMPNLLNDLVARGETCTAHPLNGFWLDIGSPAEYERAQTLFTRPERMRSVRPLATDSGTA